MFVITGLLTLLNGLQQDHLGAASLDWPTVAGVVEHAQVQADWMRGGEAAYVAHIRYSFDYGGRRISSDQMTVRDTGGLRFTGADAKVRAEQLVVQYPPGTPVLVHYDPGAPGRAVLQPGPG